MGVGADRDELVAVGHAGAGRRATANRLIFEPVYTPGPGDIVTASYFVGCIL